MMYIICIFYVRVKSLCRSSVKTEPQSLMGTVKQYKNPAAIANLIQMPVFKTSQVPKTMSKYDKVETMYG